MTAPVADAATLADITSECEITTLTEPTATDNCSGTVVVTHDATLPITASTLVTWTYDDGNGNVSTQTQNAVIIPIDNSVTQDDEVTLTANVAGATYQWIDCNDDNAPLTGETGQTFTATENGNYAVEITVNSCTETSACYVVNSVGVQTLKGNTWSVSPNPNNGLFTVVSTQSLSDALVEVYTPDGRLVYTTVYSGTELNIDLSNQTRGVYILKVNKETTFRVVKN